MKDQPLRFNRRDFIKVTSAGMFATMLAGCETLSPTEKPNILFISVDDLRPELGCYGNDEIKTPNFDALAKEGMMFKNTPDSALTQLVFGVWAKNLERYIPTSLQCRSILRSSVIIQFQWERFFTIICQILYHSMNPI